MAKEKNKEQETINTRVFTSDESAIISRVESETTEWFPIREDEIHDFSLMEDPLKLPPPAKKLQDEKRYAFRWCERTAKRVDQLCKSAAPPLKWAIVNKTTLPELKEFTDNVLGCVCCLDQMLLFKPWHHHIVVQKAKRALAENLDHAGRLESRKAKTSESYQYLVGPEHKITAGDDIQFDEAKYDAEMDGSADMGALGDLVVNE